MIKLAIHTLYRYVILGDSFFVSSSFITFGTSEEHIAGRKMEVPVQT